MDSVVDDLISVYDFAHRYRVDVSVVRGWIKRGDIPYKLVGTRKMLRTGDIPKVVRTVDPVENRKDWNMRQLVSYLVKEQGLDIEIARQVASSMSPEEIVAQLEQFKAQNGGSNGQDAQEEGREDHSPRPASTRKGTAGSSGRRATPRRSR